MNLSEDVPASRRTTRTHELKTWPEPFAAAARGEKPWEYRLNDRNYRVGDTVVRREYDPKILSYTGRVLPAERIVYILAHGFGLPHDHVVLSLVPVPTPRAGSPERPWRPGERA